MVDSVRDPSSARCSRGGAVPVRHAIDARVLLLRQDHLAGISAALALCPEPVVPATGQGLIRRGPRGGPALCKPRHRHQGIGRAAPGRGIRGQLRQTAAGSARNHCVRAQRTLGDWCDGRVLAEPGVALRPAKSLVRVFRSLVDRAAHAVQPPGALRRLVARRRHLGPDHGGGGWAKTSPPLACFR